MEIETSRRIERLESLLRNANTHGAVSNLKIIAREVYKVRLREAEELSAHANRYVSADAYETEGSSITRVRLLLDAAENCRKAIEWAEKYLDSQELTHAGQIYRRHVWNRSAKESDAYSLAPRIERVILLLNLLHTDWSLGSVDRSTITRAAASASASVLVWTLTGIMAVAACVYGNEGNDNLAIKYAAVSALGAGAGFIINRYVDRLWHKVKDICA